MAVGMRSAGQAETENRAGSWLNATRVQHASLVSLVSSYWMIDREFRPALVSPNISVNLTFYLPRLLPKPCLNGSQTNKSLCAAEKNVGRTWRRHLRPSGQRRSSVALLAGNSGEDDDAGIRTRSCATSLAKPHQCTRPRWVTPPVLVLPQELAVVLGLMMAGCMNVVTSYGLIHLRPSPWSS